MSDRPRYWAFCSNPARYRITDAVQALDSDWWTTGKSDVRRGDQVIIWQTKDKKGRRGIVALGDVTGDRELRSDKGNPFWCDPDDGSEELRVPVRYIRAPKLPLWLHETPHDDVLESLSVAKSYGGTVFHVTREQWEAVLAIVGELTDGSDPHV